MLNPKMVEQLNKQINLEFYSSNLYLQMAAWCEHHALNHCAAFLRTHAGEEMLHMQKLFDYVLETGALPLLGHVEAPQHQFSDIIDIFDKTLAHEKSITASINDLADLAFSQKDFSTFSFLQWYISEQHEEEALFTSILDRIRLLGEESKNLYFLDKAVGELINAHNQKTNKA